MDGWRHRQCLGWSGSGRKEGRWRRCSCRRRWHVRHERPTEATEEAIKGPWRAKRARQPEKRAARPRARNVAASRAVANTLAPSIQTQKQPSYVTAPQLSTIKHGSSSAESGRLGWEAVVVETRQRRTSPAGNKHHYHVPALLPQLG